MALGDDFKGLPMESLIGAPLTAACDANIRLAQATSDFIQTIGFGVGEDGKPNNEIRVAEFGYTRQIADETGALKPQKMKVEVPLLAVVQTPNLKVNNVDITFDMEVKTHSEDKSQSSKEGSLEASAKMGWGPFSAQVKVSGSVSTHKESTRSTDKSAKYHVEVKAEDTGMPEGLARVLDLMNQAVQPVPITEGKDS